jgi:hypothetical protein
MVLSYWWFLGRRWFEGFGDEHHHVGQDGFEVFFAHLNVTTAHRLREMVAPQLKITDMHTYLNPI